MTETTQPIHPGCIRIIVKLGEREGGGDFLASDLPEWIQSLDATARNPLVRGIEQSAEIARWCDWAVRTLAVDKICPARTGFGI